MKQSELWYKPWNAQDVSAKKGLSQAKEVKGERQSLFWAFFTGTDHVPGAAFLNRTPKPKLANEAAAGGEGPAHPRPWGDSQPGPAAGKPGEAI